MKNPFGKSWRRDSITESIEKIPQENGRNLSTSGSEKTICFYSQRHNGGSELTVWKQERFGQDAPFWVTEIKVAELGKVGLSPIIEYAQYIRPENGETEVNAPVFYQGNLDKLGLCGLHYIAKALDEAAEHLAVPKSTSAS